MKKTGLYIGLVLVVILVVSGLTFFLISGKTENNILLKQEEKVNGDTVKIEYYLDGRNINRKIIINNKEVNELKGTVLKNNKDVSISEAQEILKDYIYDYNVEYSYLKLKDLSNNNYFIFRDIVDDLDSPDRTLIIVNSKGQKLKDFVISTSPVYVKAQECNYNRCVNAAFSCVGNNQNLLFYAEKGNVVVQDNAIYYVTVDSEKVYENKITINNKEANVEKLGTYEIDGESVVVGYC